MTDDDTQSKIRELLAAEPFLTVAQLARKTGVSRQRAHQIVRANGLKVGRYHRDIDETRALTCPKPVVNLQVPPALLHSSAAGTIGELLAACDLMARGWHVFYPLVRTTRCDLVAVSYDGQKVRRIEVRTGKRMGARITYSKRDLSASDHFAIVLVGEPVTFMPDIELGR